MAPKCDSIDQELSSTIALINEHKRRRDILLSFAQAPTDFLNAVVASQVRGFHLSHHAMDNRGDKPWVET